MKLKISFISLIFFLTGCTITFLPSSSSSNSSPSSNTFFPDDSSKTSIDYNDPSTYWNEESIGDRNGTRTLDFYNLNDFHGTVEYNEDNDEPGMLKLTTLIKRKYAENPNGFVFTNSGDVWQGSASSNLTEGELIIDWFNYLNCKAQAIGNHEFDWGLSLIEKNITKQEYPMLACNIFDENTNQMIDSWVKPFTTTTINDVKIGIIGAVGRGLTNSIAARHVKGLDFLDPTTYVNKWADHLRENGADVVLYLMHDSVSEVDQTTLNKVDGIFGGHTHSYESETINGVPMIQSRSNGKALGHIQITYDFDKSTVINSYGENIDSKASMLRNLEDDSDAKSIYDHYYEGVIKEQNNRVVGNYRGGISSGDAPYIYNAYAYKYFKEELDVENKYDIFAIETNNARSDITALSNGDITYGAVYKAFPFDNSLVLIRIKGSNILNVLSTYSSAKFTLPGTGIVNRKNLNKYVDQNEYYYVLTINYISDGEYTAPYVEVIEEYNDDESMPRNIVAKYLNGYPNNVSI